jgi:hypothetical protein
MAEKTYPSLPGPSYAFLDSPCIAFEKYDGSNLRFFWSHRRGWHRSGTRYKWFKPVTPMFGPAVALFQQHYAQGIVETIRRHKEYRGVQELIAFCEFFGPSSFNGMHVESEAKQLMLFDVYLHGRGFVLPSDFVSHFGHLKIARVVYQGVFNRAFIENVQAGQYTSGEGVIAKGVQTRRLYKGRADQSVWMAKVKTRAWLDELARRAGDSESLLRELEQNRREQMLEDRPAEMEVEESPDEE